jgi:hypothetical protein
MLSLSLLILAAYGGAAFSFLYSSVHHGEAVHAGDSKTTIVGAPLPQAVASTRSSFAMAPAAPPPNPTATLSALPGWTAAVPVTTIAPPASVSTPKERAVSEPKKSSGKAVPRVVAVKASRSKPAVVVRIEPNPVMNPYETTEGTGPEKGLPSDE